MKRIFSIVLLFLSVAFCASAQKELGEYIEIDGVPSCVIHYDEDGVHGVAISIPGFWVKEAKKVDKYVSKGLMTEAQGKIFRENLIGSGLTKKKEKIDVSDLMNQLSDDGKKNQEKIEAYCEKNGISLQERFPLQYWAKSLGEGWFIPGDQELTYFANMYFGGLGRSNSLGTKTMSHAKELCSNELVQEMLARMVFSGIYSSSCHNAEWGFRALRPQFVKLTGKWYMEILDTFSGRTPEVCAAHYF